MSDENRGGILQSEYSSDKAEIGPRANNDHPSGGGSVSFPSLDEGYDEEDFEKEASEQEDEVEKQAEDDFDLEKAIDDIAEEEGHEKEAKGGPIPKMEAGDRPVFDDPGNSGPPPPGPDPELDTGTAPDTLRDAVKGATEVDNQESQVVGQEEEFMRDKNREEYQERQEYLSTDPEVGKLDSHPGELAGSHVEMRKNSSANMLDLIEDDEANPIRVKWALDNQYDREWYNWEPETIWETLRKDGVENPSSVNKHVILAIKATNNTDEFFRNWRAFEKTCVAFSGREVDFGHVQEVRLHDVAVTVHMVRSFIKEEEFQDEVKSYIAACAIRDGFVMLPKELGFASLNFSKEIVQRMGDEVLMRQREIQSALDGDVEPEELDQPDQIQFVRMQRVKYHVDSILEELRSS